MSSIAAGRRWAAALCQPARRQAGSSPTRRERLEPVLGQHLGRAAAQPGQVVDDADGAEHAGEGERAPLEVPVVGAVDGRRGQARLTMTPTWNTTASSSPPGPSGQVKYGPCSGSATSRAAARSAAAR